MEQGNSVSVSFELSYFIIFLSISGNPAASRMKKNILYLFVDVLALTPQHSDSVSVIGSIKCEINKNLMWFWERSLKSHGMELITPLCGFDDFGVNCRGDNWRNQSACSTRPKSLKQRIKFESREKRRRLKCSKNMSENQKVAVVDVCKSSAATPAKRVIISNNMVVQFKSLKIIFICLTYSRLMLISCLIYLSDMRAWSACKLRRRNEECFAYPREIVW